MSKISLVYLTSFIYTQGFSKGKRAGVVTRIAGVGWFCNARDVTGCLASVARARTRTEGADQISEKRRAQEVIEVNFGS